jgi:hypothetical protein
MKQLLATLMLVASVTAGHAGEDTSDVLAATPDVLAGLAQRFPNVHQDSAFMMIGAGMKCRGCHLVWFETSDALWACNFTFGTKINTFEPVKIKNCWNRHA